MKCPKRFTTHAQVDALCAVLRKRLNKLWSRPLPTHYQLLELLREVDIAQHNAHRDIDAKGFHP